MQQSKHNTYNGLTTTRLIGRKRNNPFGNSHFEPPQKKVCMQEDTQMAEDESSTATTESLDSSEGSEDSIIEDLCEMIKEILSEHFKRKNK